MSQDLICSEIVFSALAGPDKNMCIANTVYTFIKYLLIWYGFGLEILYLKQCLISPYSGNVSLIPVARFAFG